MSDLEKILRKHERQIAAQVRKIEAARTPNKPAGASKEEMSKFARDSLISSYDTIRGKKNGGAFDKHRGPTTPDNRTPEQKRKDREKLQAERRGGPDKSSGSANLSGVKRYRKNGGAIMKARGGTFKGTF